MTRPKETPSSMFPVARLGVMVAVAAVATALLAVGLHSKAIPGSSLAPAAHGSSAGSSPSAAAGQGSTGTSGSSTQGASATKSQATRGPLLSSTPYAQAAYQVYPGTMSFTTKQAIDGFSFHFVPVGAKSEQVSVYVAGQSSAVLTKVFASSYRLYFIETSFGDDAPGTDLNGGDDSLILTDASGYIIQ